MRARPQELQQTVASFKVEQILLAQQAPAVATQRAVRGDPPAAGNNDSDWILPVCLRDRANRLLVAHPARLLEIGDSLAIADAAQRSPDSFLEGCSGKAQRDFEAPARACEVLGELAPGLIEQRRVGARLCRYRVGIGGDEFEHL